MEKPEIGTIIKDDEGIKWEVTDNVNSDKFLWQQRTILQKIKSLFGGKIDFWIPVKRTTNNHNR